MEERTIDSILGYFQEVAEKKIPASPSQYLDAAQMLSSLSSNLDDELIEAEMKYRRLRASFIEEGTTASEAEIRAKASEEYGRYLSLKAKRNRVDSFIQISKKRADLQNWDS